MTKNELKKQLRAYRAQQLERQQIEELMRETRLLLDGLRGNGMNGMPRGSGVSDPVANMLTRYEALEQRYAAAVARLVDAMAAVEDIIAGLDFTERRLMRCRYIEGQTWEQVCVSTGYSWRQAHNIHTNALDKLVEQEAARNAGDSTEN